MKFIRLVASLVVAVGAGVNCGCRPGTSTRPKPTPPAKQSSPTAKGEAPAFQPWKYETMDSVKGIKNGSNNQPVIPTVIRNDKKSAQPMMGMDTGSTGTTISRTLFNKLGLKVLRYEVEALGRRVPIARIPWLQVGNMWISGVEAEVLEDRVMKHDLGLADGIIGTDILGHAKILLDVPKRQVYVTSRSLPVDGMTAVDMIPLKGGGYGAKVAINGQERLLLIDTGSYHTTIVKDEIPKGIVKKGTPCYNDTGAYGDIKTCDGVADIRIGAAKYPHVLIGIAERHTYQNVEEAGEIGMDLLGKQRVVIDLPQRKMYIAR